MKKIYLTGLAIFALFAVSCNKETPSSVEPFSNDSVITGIINPETVKTAYDNEGKFSWVANDQITVQVIGTAGTANEGKYDFWPYKTSSGGSATTTFTRESDPINWEIGDYAFYPRNLETFDLVYQKTVNPIKVKLSPETYEYYYTSTNPLKMVPMVGEKLTESGTNATFEFVAATGVLKLNFSNVPAVNGLRLILSHPTYPLCGVFSLDTDNTIKATNYVSDKAARTLQPSGGFSEAYVALPIGQIPAGLNILLKKTSGEIYADVTTKTAIDIKKNTITNLTQPIKAVSSSVSITGTSTSPVANLTVSSGEEVAFAVSTSEANALSSLASATWYLSTQNVSLTDVSEPLGSKQLYFAYKVKASDGHVYLKRAISYYYLTTADAGKYAKAFDMKVTENGTERNSHITFAVSDNPNKGNIMVTEFDGIKCIGANTSTPMTTTYTEISQWGDGAPIYGLYPSTDSSTKIEFYNMESNVFYYDHNGKKHVFASSTLTSSGANNKKWRFAINSAAYTTGTNRTIICWTGISNWYGEPDGSYTAKEGYDLSKLYSTEEYSE